MAHYDSTDTTTALVQLHTALMRCKVQPGFWKAAVPVWRHTQDQDDPLHPLTPEGEQMAVAIGVAIRNAPIVDIGCIMASMSPRTKATRDFALTQSSAHTCGVGGKGHDIVTSGAFGYDMVEQCGRLNDWTAKKREIIATAKICGLERAKVADWFKGWSHTEQLIRIPFLTGLYDRIKAVNMSDESVLPERMVPPVGPDDEEIRLPAQICWFPVFSHAACGEVSACPIGLREQIEILEWGCGVGVGFVVDRQRNGVWQIPDLCIPIPAPKLVG